MIFSQSLPLTLYAFCSESVPYKDFITAMSVTTTLEIPIVRTINVRCSKGGDIDVEEMYKMHPTGELPWNKIQ